MHVAADTIEALRSEVEYSYRYRERLIAAETEIERLRAVLVAPVGEPLPYAFPPEGEEAAGA
jgi:hypothetical protein